MKQNLRNLRIGQQVWAVIEEIIAQREVIINFDGDLVRVRNLTSKSLKAGSRILLEVETVRPLSFRLVPQQTQNNGQAILDLTI